MLKNWLARMTYGEVFKVLGFGFMGAFFLLFLYWGFIRVLWEVKSVQIVGSLLSLKLMAMVFLTTFLMIIFSSTLASLTTLFFAKDLPILFHSPLSFRSVFMFKSLETSVFSSWMVVLAIFPFLGAFGHVYDLGKDFYGLLAVLSVPFVGVACVIGIGVSLVLMCLFSARRVREVLLVMGILVGGGLFVLVRWLGPEKLVRADSFEVLLQYVALLEAPTAPYLPSWWMASAVMAFVAERKMDVVGYGGLLFGAVLLAGAIVVFFAEKMYYSGWAAAQESPRGRKAIALGREWVWIPSFLGRHFRALLGKDALIFSRDASQWTQLLLLLSLVAVYLVSIHKLPLDTPYLKGLISFLNIGMMGFVLASVALRFVFPAVSLEGKSWWAIRAAPLSLWHILWGKFLSGFLPLVLTGLLLAWVSNWLLEADAFIHWLSYGTVFMMAFTLTGMGIGFGSLFPRFHVENVAQIETSPGGLFYMISALFYVGLTLVLEAVLMRIYYWMLVGRTAVWPATVVLWVAGALALVNLSAFIIPFVMGKKYLEKVDI